jgi:hypothetical protein
MALTFKDVSGNQTNAAGTTLVTSSMTMGATVDLVVVCLVTWDSSTIPTHQAPTDTQGNTYLQLGTTQAVPAGNIRISLWYCANPTTGVSTQVTTHQSALTSARTVIAWCIAGAGAYNSDVGTNTGSSAATQTVTSSGAQLGGLMLAAMTNNTTAVVSGPTDDDARSWNPTTNNFDALMKSSAAQTDNSTFQDAFMAWIAPNDAAESANWTSTATNFAGLIAGFGDPIVADLPAFDYSTFPKFFMRPT